MTQLRFLLIAFVMVFAPATSLSQKIAKESTSFEGKKRTYYLYIPSNLKPAASVPLLVLLHGSNRNGLSLAEKWKDLAEQEGFILLAPDSANPAVWSIPGDGPAFLHELVESIRAKYSINGQKIYLFGHSGGAIFALSMSLYESEYFAATAIHAGLLNPDTLFLIDLAKRKVPIYIQVGSNDPLFPVALVRSTRDVLTQKGFAVELTEIPGHDHWYYDLAPKINQSAWQFLKARGLSTEPRYEEHIFRAQAQNSRAATEQYNLGMKRHAAGDLAAAIAAYTKAIELDGKFAEAYNNRGIAYMSQNDYAAAVPDFSRSIEIKPSDAAYNNRGGIYLTQHKFSEAIADFTESIKIKDSVEARANRGVAYEQTNQDAFALADYEGAIQLDPNFARAYVLRGLLSLKTGKEASAQKDFDKAFQLDPGLHAEFDPIINQRKANRRMN
jgi:tetratricopeptide (TPR) repeat protein